MTMVERAAVIAVCIAGAGCFPTYDFSGGEDGGAGTDATLDANGAPDVPFIAFDHVDEPEGSIDAGSDVTSPPLPPTVQVLLPSVPIATESGGSQQRHLIFAAHSNRYWLFYIDADGAKLKTRWSTDLATWTEGNALTLPMGHGGEGRNFSVGYADLAGTDVVHVALSLYAPPTRKVYDARATIAGDAITFATPVLAHDITKDPGYSDIGGCDPDGNGVAITPDGRVFLASAWVAVQGCCECDSNVFTASGLDVGGAGWDAGIWGTQHYTVPGTSNAHQIVALASNDLIAGWEQADRDPQCSNVRWASRVGGAWSSNDDYVFTPEDDTTIQEFADWSLCRVDDAHVHAIRRRYQTLLPDGGASGGNQVFEHYLFNGASWASAGALPADPGIAGSGVVLLTNGHGLLAAAIGATSVVRYATWDGSTWSAWKTLAGDDAGTAQRAFVSGSGCEDPQHPVVTWTEGAGPGYRVMGVPVGSLIP